MRVFISWGGKSEKLANFFFNWIRKLPLSIDPWVAKKAIDPGTRWEKELSEALEGTNFGIFFITLENQYNPWICFEAGALSKEVEKSRVVPYLIDLEPSKLQQPFAQFQAVKANKDDTWDLIEKIFMASGDNSRNVVILKETFDKWWPDLEKEIIQARKEVGEVRAKDAEITNEEVKNTLDKVLAISESISERLIKLENIQHISRQEGALSAASALLNARQGNALNPYVSALYPPWKKGVSSVNCLADLLKTPKERKESQEKEE